LTVLTTFFTPVLFATRDSMDCLDAIFLGLDFLAFARLELVFLFAEEGVVFLFAEESVGRLFVREAAD
jgi:hypothetical protein